MQKANKSNKEDAISDFPNLPAPALRALHNAGLFQLDDLTIVSEAELEELHGMGPKAIQNLKKALAKKDLGFLKQSS